MKVLIIDGQGGKIGKALVESVKKLNADIQVLAIGTNSIATTAMIKGGADEAATGENPVVVCAPKADVIMGPIGILVADALLGEVTPRMAVAIGQSEAQKILIPVNRCNNQVAGVGGKSAADLIADAIAILKKVM